MEVARHMKGKVKHGASSAATFLLIVALLLVLNLISVNLFARLDLTQGKVFSLSKASKEVIRNLDDRLIIRVYFTPDLPPPYNSLARYLKDQLEEYQAYAGGKLKLEMIDPIEEKELEAQRYGIPPLQVNALEDDQIEIKKVYMGLVLLFEDKKEVIPVVQNISGLEYELTSAIRRISTRTPTSIGFLVGKDGPDPETELTYLNQALSRYYEVKRINLDEGERIPASVRVLIILGPGKPLSLYEKYWIDQFLMKGGKLAFLFNHIEVDLQQAKAEKLNLGLEEFLQNYGIKINDDLVIDMQCNRIGVTQQQGPYSVQNIINYPYFPIATDFDKNSLIVKDLGTVCFNFVSSLDSGFASIRGIRFDPIVRSSKNSGVQTAPFDINPFREFGREDFTPGGLILAATLQGSFKSNFSDRDRSEIEAEVGFVDSILTQSPPTRMVAAGDADFVKDRNLRGTDNLAFFLNIVDWLSQDEALITIRSKQVNPRPLKQLSSGTKKLIKYGNTFGLPLLVIMFGVVRWQIKKRVKRKNFFDF
jgi:gliding-associated putative ABC transporter substrate-binding component GldG